MLRLAIILALAGCWTSSAYMAPEQPRAGRRSPPPCTNLLEYTGPIARRPDVDERCQDAESFEAQLYCQVQLLDDWGEALQVSLTSAIAWCAP